MAIIATPGASDANSYVTLAEANAYHDVRLHNALWTAADDPTKEKALIWSTETLDANMNWKERRSEQTQALQWPRQGVHDRDGFLIDSDVVPVQVKKAQSVLAFLSIKSDVTLNADSKSPGASKVKVSSLSVDLDLKNLPGILSAAVVSLVQHLGTFSGVGANQVSKTVTLVRS